MVSLRLFHLSPRLLCIREIKRISLASGSTAGLYIARLSCEKEIIVSSRLFLPSRLHKRSIVSIRQVARECHSTALIEFACIIILILLIVRVKNRYTQAFSSTPALYVYMYNSRSSTADGIFSPKTRERRTTRDLTLVHGAADPGALLSIFSGAGCQVERIFSCCC